MWPDDQKRLQGEDAKADRERDTEAMPFGTDASWTEDHRVGGDVERPHSDGDTARGATADAEARGENDRDVARWNDAEYGAAAENGAPWDATETVRREEASRANQASYGADAARRRAQEAEVRKWVRDEVEHTARPKASPWRSVLLVLVSALLGAGGGAALVASGVVPMGSSSTVVQQAPSEIRITAEGDATTVENAVAAKAIPSIVGITTITQGQSNPFIFGMKNYMEAVGSGVIVSQDGYILTNSHVVNSGDAESVKVLLSTGEEQEAEVMWADPTLDLAVIKIDSTGLPAVEFGQAEDVKVGDKAIAIGNPLGLDLQSTLTSGFISGLNRSITLQDGNIMDGLIQTDAAINSGNSGGALLNAQGQLIGINTARPSSADGIGFAIPVSTVQPIVEKILANGKFEPLYLGITGYNAELASQLGMLSDDIDNGVIVRDVVAGSPAAEADIRPGDIITAIDDKPVESMNTLKTILLGYKAGDTANFTLWRSGEESHVDLTFSDFTPPEESAQPQSNRSDSDTEEAGWFTFPWGMNNNK
ncbi:MAG: trypsin-like peptidase domain-containing protein [Peptoniphilaceae bacterium]|nr:trypsin-like peptidase domain-containing protein [Peptoniphilaceae bacterium]MDY6086332.1 trypsin-like peptidase domain-containing protein [Peptoniphilaceae bacterium]